MHALTAKCVIASFAAIVPADGMRFCLEEVGDEQEELEAPGPLESVAASPDMLSKSAARASQPASAVSKADTRAASTALFPFYCA